MSVSEGLGSNSKVQYQKNVINMWENYINQIGFLFFYFLKF
jgi:hypothetical protein